jgi:hypothetical protein
LEKPGKAGRRHLRERRVFFDKVSAMKLAAWALLAAFGSVLPALAPHSIAHACTLGPVSWRFHDAEVVISGRVQGYELVEGYAGDTDRTVVRFGLIVHEVYKGEVPKQFAFIDSGVHWNAEMSTILPDGTCGGLAGEPTDAYVLLGLHRNVLGELTTSGAFIFFRGQSHLAPEFNAAVASFDGPPAPGPPDAGSGIKRDDRGYYHALAAAALALAAVSGAAVLFTRRPTAG